MVGDAADEMYALVLLCLRFLYSDCEIELYNINFANHIEF